MPRSHGRHRKHMKPSDIRHFFRRHGFLPAGMHFTPEEVRRIDPGIYLWFVMQQVTRAKGREIKKHLPKEYRKLFNADGSLKTVAELEKEGLLEEYERLHGPAKRRERGEEQLEEQPVVRKYEEPKRFKKKK